MAVLVSVNVGLPRDVTWRGRTVHTGIWKAPVAGPVTARRLNLDGDGQGDTAGHGGEMRAVMVYQLDSYRYWAKELGRNDFVHGQFGENFTVEGLADGDVCIGDRYRIGGAVFEVSQPRVTCYRVGIRMDEPRMAALLVAHKRPGFYFRVVEEGDVAAGQEIVKIADGPGRLTVAEVDALLYLPGPPRERIRAARDLAALSPGWRESFNSMLDQSESASGNPGLQRNSVSPPPAWPGFRALRVTATTPESRTITSFHLADPDGAPLPTALPGQYLTLRLPAEGDESSGPVRSYSLSGRPGAPEYRISVKREPHGAASTWLHNRTKAGDTLEAAAPRGAFTLRAEEDGPVLLASAGVGATPVLAMLHALADASSARQVWWVHAARDGREHAFAGEAAQLLERLPAARSRVCYSHPAAQDRLGTDYTDRGHLNRDTLAELAFPDTTQAYVCGPSSFMDDVRAALESLGLPAERVRTEVFGAGASLTPGIAAGPSRPPHAPQGPPGTGPLVSFARSGLSVPWHDGHGSLLEFAEACDVPVRWSCRTGVCHTCESGLLSGAVTYDPDPVEPPTTGDILICCSRPDGDVTLDL
ncbi:MOSC and FAD-binding oxidoreductase domain-containing protein [Streptomyces sp. NPDC048295]|uniref:MOSC and FAD-binding oxidoreductase domain-containing protein n=1 Tax=Streptomyces sp. NPDC048295 TaxID=3154617 RepID=UPI0034226130